MAEPRQYLTQEEVDRLREMAWREPGSLLATLLRDRDLAWSNANEAAEQVNRLKAEIAALRKRDA